MTVAFWNYVAATPGGIPSAFGANGINSANRFQAHVPWGNNNIYWDYGNISGLGRLETSYNGHYGKWTHVALVSAGASGGFMAIYLRYPVFALERFSKMAALIDTPAPSTISGYTTGCCLRTTSRLFTPTGPVSLSSRLNRRARPSPPGKRRRLW